ncbi:TPA: hypothetical protein ND641_004391 [Citrobacter amalonaticus]|nr:hypothetical protein [Citrobacter amalonaticus]
MKEEAQSGSHNPHSAGQYTDAPVHRPVTGDILPAHRATDRLSGAVHQNRKMIFFNLTVNVPHWYVLFTSPNSLHISRGFLWRQQDQ